MKKLTFGGQELILLFSQYRRSIIVLPQEDVRETPNRRCQCQA